MCTVTVNTSNSTATYSTNSPTLDQSAAGKTPNGLKVTHGESDASVGISDPQAAPPSKKAKLAERISYPARNAAKQIADDVKWGTFLGGVTIGSFGAGPGVLLGAGIGAGIGGINKLARMLQGKKSGSVSRSAFLGGIVGGAIGGAITGIPGAVLGAAAFTVASLAGSALNLPFDIAKAIKGKNLALNQNQSALLLKFGLKGADRLKDKIVSVINPMPLQEALNTLQLKAETVDRQTLDKAYKDFNLMVEP